MSVVKAAADGQKHEGDVTSIILHEETLYSAGSDGKIKVDKRIIRVIHNFPDNSTRSLNF